ncbi:hypothetical protein [Sinorhizobium sp. BG8]|uniref:hypothetical protein n=1 Tax=Sinorhizobium sp. BG8 TaxID=2613773 RepID=UPI00193EB9B8|nr:hypothetical protein [Sinorhizobium sp. BG8]QRM56251.1 hypothetical protein F3Y30_18190 [Sinorhizobium sp. BG8]
MFLDDENARSAVKANEARALFYIAMTALVACMLMVFGMMGTAQAETSVPAPITAVGHLSPSAVLAVAQQADTRTVPHTAASDAAATVDVAANPTTGSISTTNSAVDAPIADRGLLMVLVVILFGLMAWAGHVLVRQSLFQSKRPRKHQSEA